MVGGIPQRTLMRADGVSAVVAAMIPVWVDTTGPKELSGDGIELTASTERARHVTLTFVPDHFGGNTAQPSPYPRSGLRRSLTPTVQGKTLARAL
jgi:hypothetical protein